MMSDRTPKWSRAMGSRFDDVQKNSEMAANRQYIGSRVDDVQTFPNGLESGTHSLEEAIDDCFGLDFKPQPSFQAGRGSHDSGCIRRSRARCLDPAGINAGRTNFDSAGG
ncbi:hypothetical protein VE23_21110 [Paenibacillus sp. D9]|nr:hypothetical protein VE23_21110 [Paenibacillus sp. D9]